MARQFTLTQGNSTRPELGCDDRLELFYGFTRGIDGHGGPYTDLAEAQERAAALLNGCASMLYIEIRRELAAGGWQTIQTLRKSTACPECGR